MHERTIRINIDDKNSSTIAGKFRKITVFRIEVTKQIKFWISIGWNFVIAITNYTFKFFNDTFTFTIVFQRTNAYISTVYCRDKMINRYVENIF